MYRVALALFLFFLMQTVHAELSVDYGADAYVRWYSNSNEVRGFLFPSETGKKQGFAQMMRLRLDLKHEEGVSLKTRTLLVGDKWGGDNPKNNSAISGNSDDIGGGYTVRMDYGFLEYAKPGFLFRAGRQESNWAECLTNCDDRRDRFLVMIPAFDGFIIAVADKRESGLETRDGDDGDMLGLLYLRYGGNYEAGILAAYWNNSDKTYPLTGVTNISPYVKFRHKDLNVNLLANWVGMGSSKSWYPDHHYAVALQSGYQLTEKWKVEAQTLQIRNAGYISTGFDTYLSMVNNNPEHNQSNISAFRLGAFGTFFSGGRDASEYLYSVRTHYALTDKWQLGIAGGLFSNYQFFTKKTHKHEAIDATAKYQLTSRALIRGSFGRVLGDKQVTTSAVNFEASF